MALQHLRSATANKRPTPGSMSDGQLGINTNTASPGVFFKDSTGALVKVGPVHVGATAPNTSPAAGGEAGNSIGEQWLDTSSSRYVFKIWDGSAWRTEDGEFVNASGDTMTGALVMDNQQQIRFRETTANGTNYIALQAPSAVTSDKTITLPDVTGTVVTTGDTGTVTSTMIADGTIVNGDISASAEIAVSKLADGAARQLLQTDAAGTGVEWTDNVDVPGTLDVTGAATFDSSVTIAGDLTVNGTTTNINTQNLVVEDKNIILADVTTPTDTTADGGGITLKGASDKTITWSDTTDSWEFNQPTITTGTSTAASFIPSGSTVPTNGVYLSAANTVAVATNSTGRLFVDSSGRLLVGTNTSRAVGSSGESLLQAEIANSGLVASFTRNSNDGTAAVVILGKSRSTTVGGVAIVQANDTLGELRFAGADGTDLQTNAAWIRGEVDGTPGADDMPGRLVFFTTADGASSPTERLRITSTGNVGIGTSSPGSFLHVNAATGVDTYIRTTNSNATGGFDFGLSSGGDAYLFNRNNKPLVFGTNSAESARLDSSGRLLVGTSSALTNYQWFDTTYIAPSLQVANENVAQASFGLFCNNAVDSSASQLMLAKAASGTAGLVNSGETLGAIAFNGADGTNLIRAASIQAAVDGTPSANDMPGRLVFSTTADGASSLTERMRISSNGQVDIFNGSGSNLLVRSANAAGTTDNIFVGHYSATTIANGTVSIAVRTNGNIVNTNNSYGSLSDIKLKENIVDANSQWDDLKALQVRNYNFKEGQTHTQIGLIAQEVELVSPGLVSESPDRDEEGNDLGTVTKSVNYSVLYMKAVKALQEAMERIETLEAKVAALEAS